MSQVVFPLLEPCLLLPAVQAQVTVLSKSKHQESVELDLQLKASQRPKSVAVQKTQQSQTVNRSQH